MLKGRRAGPSFKASGIDTDTEPVDDADGSGEGNGAVPRPRKRAGSPIRRKTRQVTILATLEAT